jgi:hypothetical protein
MTTTTLHQPMTARLFLFGDGNGADSAQVIGRAVHEQGVARASLHGARRLTGSALEAVDQELGEVASGLLDLDLGDLLVAGWKKYESLTDSARRTLASPGSEEVVLLATHQITCSYQPYVDLLLDGVRLNSFEIDLTLVFEVTGVEAVVRAGDLVALRGGRCQVAGTLSLEGARLVERDRGFDLGLLVSLPRPIPLVEKPSPFIPEQASGLEQDSPGRPSQREQ